MLCSQHGRILAQSRRRDRGQGQQRGAVVEGSVQVRPAPPHGVSAPLVIPLSSPCSDFCVSVCLPPLLLVCASPLPFCLAPPLRLSPLSAPHPFVLLGCSASLLCANSSQLRRAQRIPTAASTPPPQAFNSAAEDQCGFSVQSHAAGLVRGFGFSMCPLFSGPASWP